MREEREQTPKSKSWPPALIERGQSDSESKRDASTGYGQAPLAGFLMGLALGAIVGLCLPITLAFFDGMVVSPQSSEALPDLYLLPVPWLIEIPVAVWLFFRNRIAGLTFGLASVAVSGVLLLALELLPPGPPG